METLKAKSKFRWKKCCKMLARLERVFEPTTQETAINKSSQVLIVAVPIVTVIVTVVLARNLRKSKKGYCPGYPLDSPSNYITSGLSGFTSSPGDWPVSLTTSCTHF